MFEAYGWREAPDELSDARGAAADAEPFARTGPGRASHRELAYHVRITSLLLGSNGEWPGVLGLAAAPVPLRQRRTSRPPGIRGRVEAADTGLGPHLANGRRTPVSALALPQLTEMARTFFHKDELPAEFAWVDFLTPHHLRLFVVDLNDAIKASTEDGGASLREVYDSWEATAAVDADAALQKRLLAGRDQKKSYPAWRPTEDKTTG